MWVLNKNERGRKSELGILAKVFLSKSHTSRIVEMSVTSSIIVLLKILQGYIVIHWRLRNNEYFIEIVDDIF